jgi:aspartate aminotransferase
MAAKAAVEADPIVVEEMVEVFKKRRDLVYDLIKDIPGLKVNIPEGAFYFFPDVRSFFGKRDGEKVIQDADELCLYLLEKHQLALVTGSAFGDPNCIRISYATHEEVLIDAMNRLKKGLSELS